MGDRCWQVDVVPSDITCVILISSEVLVNPFVADSGSVAFAYMSSLGTLCWGFKNWTCVLLTSRELWHSLHVCSWDSCWGFRVYNTCYVSLFAQFFCWMFMDCLFKWVPLKPFLMLQDIIWHLLHVFVTTLCWGFNNCDLCYMCSLESLVDGSGIWASNV